MTQEPCDKTHKNKVVALLGSRPKTLAERLQWMADNLPGFREELAAVEQAQRRAIQSTHGPAQLDVIPSHGERA